MHNMERAAAGDSKAPDVSRDMQAHHAERYMVSLAMDETVLVTT